MPTVAGYKLDPPDRLKDDDTPVCCKRVMAHKGSRDGYQVYECGGCGTVLAVAPNGRIYVLKEG
jgi:hypothetical protein